MIDLTPLDVRNKRGDFKRLMRGYDPQEVDVFLEMVAERLEGLVRENLQLKERTGTLQQQVTSQLGREQAVQDALVTAQELRADIKAQSQREAEHVLKEAETEARRVIAEAEAQVRGKLRGVERRVDGASGVLGDLERRRARFLQEFRLLLERELDAVEVEESRTALEDRTIDLDLGSTHGAVATGGTALAGPDPAVDPAVDTGPEPEAAAEAPPALDEPTPPPLSADDADTVPEVYTLYPDRPATEAAPEETREAGSSPRAEGPGPPATRFDEITSDIEAPHPPARPGLPTELSVNLVPSALETPSFTSAHQRPPPLPESAPGETSDDQLSTSMQAEALAEARSQVVEVTGADGDPLADVPRLEEVLAEAGAEFADVSIEPVSSAPQTVEEIAPPSISGQSEEKTLLYLDPDENNA